MGTKNEEIKRKKKLKKLKSSIIKGDSIDIESMLNEDKSLTTEPVSSDGSTILHFAVGLRRRNQIMKDWLGRGKLDKEQLLIKRDSDGSTALQIAAIVGNTEAAKLLVEKNDNLLHIKDNIGDLPLDKAHRNMHLDTLACLLEASNDYTTISSSSSTAVDLIVNAIFAKKYSLATQFLHQCPKAASESDEVLMALAKTFPSGLNDGERLFYPSLKSTLEVLRKTPLVVVREYTSCLRLLRESIDSQDICSVCIELVFMWPMFLVLATVPPIKKIEKKIIEQEEAKKFIFKLCDDIDKLNCSDTHHRIYTRPILEAACQNAYYVVDEILSRSPEAIRSKDNNGYDIIQLAIINRSEKIYNLIYDFDECKNLQKVYKDSSKNNILHLAGRLAPSSVLIQRTGAALQLQRELQWHEEVKKLVIPTYINQENISKETPDMVFTREHKDLVKEGEQWMKTTSESCSITAAAAITVPGGSHQENGTPLFRKEVAFIIFAVSDAISLFSSSTALLVFLSILTARFSEKDFLVSLPSKLFIGLFSLLLSTTSMMVAFSATLFLVFCDRKPWMLVPICGLAIIPIVCFVGLQFPLMVDLFSSTYLPIFGEKRKFTINNFVRNIMYIDVDST